jgi:hypothetical protein
MAPEAACCRANSASAARSLSEAWEAPVPRGKSGCMHVPLTTMRVRTAAASLLLGAPSGP